MSAAKRPAAGQYNDSPLTGQTGFFSNFSSFGIWSNINKYYVAGKHGGQHFYFSPISNSNSPPSSGSINELKNVV